MEASVVPAQGASPRAHLVRSTPFPGSELGFMPTELGEKKLARVPKTGWFFGVPVSVLQKGGILLPSCLSLKKLVRT